MPAELTHPQNIRQWHREQQATLTLSSALPEDTPEIVTPAPTPKFATKRDAEKFIKVDQRAESAVFPWMSSGRPGGVCTDRSKQGKVAQFTDLVMAH